MEYTATYLKLADFGRELLNKKSLEEGLPLISEYIKDIVKSDRCSIFIYDEKNSELWTTIADGVEKIVIPSNKGIVGHTIDVKKPVIENDAYASEHFLESVDKETGYKTENIGTAPIFNSQREIIGVLELLNKSNGFSNEDIKFMIFFAHYISGFLELSSNYR